MIEIIALLLRLELTLGETYCRRKMKSLYISIVRKKSKKETLNRVHLLR